MKHIIDDIIAGIRPVATLTGFFLALMAVVILLMNYPPAGIGVALILLCWIFGYLANEEKRKYTEHDR